MKDKYIAAIIGGACSGSEAAKQLADIGVDVIVFDQNDLPYGKIEDGLPRWHDKLRTRECNSIDEKLNHPRVHYLPSCKLGRDVNIEDLLEWGFSFVILGNGAWKDRTLHIEGLEKVKDLSFAYQNPFIFWFNHYPERNYKGETYPVKEGATIIGGGLASIDVMKACQLEMTRTRLKERGIECGTVELEHAGIAKFLEKHDIDWQDLNITPPTLYYRRRIKDMPLATAPEDASPEKIAKIEQVREKIVNNACKKYLFHVKDLHKPAKIHTENGSVVGVTFHKTRIEDGKVIDSGEEEYVETNFVVSSIGSTPEPIPGINMIGELYDIVHEESGRLRQFPNVFGVGNAITGKGNIQVSLKHSRYIAQFLADCLVATGPDFDAMMAGQQESIGKEMAGIAEYISHKPAISDENREKIMAKVKNWHEKHGYENYIQWRDSILAQR